MVKAIIKIIVEILIAIALFYVIAKYTPVFDRFFADQATTPSEPNTSQTTSGDNNNSSVKVQTKTTYYDQSGKAISQQEYLKQFDNEADQLIASINNSQYTKKIITTDKQSCITPRGSRVPHGASVTAYLSEKAYDADRCETETRQCNNGSLAGSFTSNTCNHIISYNADSSATNRYTDSKQLFRIPYVAPPQEYIQPVLAMDNGRSFKTNGEVSTSNNKEISDISWKNKRIPHTAQNSGDWIQDRKPVVQLNTSCSTPRGDTIAHGSFVYAYNIEVDTSGHEECRFEKRACLNGDLTGNYKYKDCKTVKTTKYPRYTYSPLYNPTTSN